MDESILITIKKMLGVTEEAKDFDTEIINHINTVLTDLTTQLGVGPTTGFNIEDDSASWKDYLDNMSNFYQVKTYIWLRVRLLFDPPSNASVLKAYEQQVKELEWRLNFAAETL